jgi:hypothetical protein
MEGPAVLQLDDGTWRIFMDGQGSLPFVTATSPDLSKWSAWVALPGLGDVVRRGTVIRDVPTGGAAADAGGLADAAGAGPDGRAATVPMDAGNPVAPELDEGGDASKGQPDAGKAEGSTPGAIGPGPSDSGMGFPGEGSPDSGMGPPGERGPEDIAGGPSAKGGCACDVTARPERGPAGAAGVVTLLVFASVALWRVVAGRRWGPRAGRRTRSRTEIWSRGRTPPR